jgi:hypothetical protein
MADQSGEPPNSHLPVDRSEAISSNTWWAIAATISLLIIAIAARTRSRLPMNPLTTRCADRLS